MKSLLNTYISLDVIFNLLMPWRSQHTLHTKFVHASPMDEDDTDTHNIHQHTFTPQSPSHRLPQIHSLLISLSHTHTHTHKQWRQQHSTQSLCFLWRFRLWGDLPRGDLDRDLLDRLGLKHNIPLFKCIWYCCVWVFFSKQTSFFCVPQLYLWGSPFWVRFCVCDCFCNPTTEVPSHIPSSWMMHVGCVFVASIHLSRTWISGSFESVRQKSCVHRLDLKFIL